MSFRRYLEVLAEQERGENLPANHVPSTFRTEDQRIIVANYAVSGESFVTDKPRVWFGTPLANIGLGVNFDLAPDGKRFVVLMPAESPQRRDTQSHVTLVL